MLLSQLACMTTPHIMHDRRDGRFMLSDAGASFAFGSHTHPLPCRRLCQTWHPDVVSTDKKSVAEAKFRQIKNAYDTILKGRLLSLATDANMPMRRACCRSNARDR